VLRGHFSLSAFLKPHWATDGRTDGWKGKKCAERLGEIDCRGAHTRRACRRNLFLSFAPAAVKMAFYTLIEKQRLILRRPRSYFSSHGQLKLGLCVNTLK
jgi:hypothetical protein